MSIRPKYAVPKVRKHWEQTKLFEGLFNIEEMENIAVEAAVKAATTVRTDGMDPDKWFDLQWDQRKIWWRNEVLETLGTGRPASALVKDAAVEYDRSPAPEVDADEGVDWLERLVPEASGLLEPNERAFLLAVYEVGDRGKGNGAWVRQAKDAGLIGEAVKGKNAKRKALTAHRRILKKLAVPLQAFDPLPALNAAPPKPAGKSTVLPEDRARYRLAIVKCPPPADGERPRRRRRPPGVVELTLPASPPDMRMATAKRRPIRGCWYARDGSVSSSCDGWAVIPQSLGKRFEKQPTVASRGLVIWQWTTNDEAYDAFFAALIDEAKDELTSGVTPADAGPVTKPKKVYYQCAFCRCDMARTYSYCESAGCETKYRENRRRSELVREASATPTPTSRAAAPSNPCH